MNTESTLNASMHTNRSINVGIIGVSGYTGLELLKLLTQHHVFNLCYVANTQGDTRIGDIHKMLDSMCIADLPISQANAKEAVEKCELIFLALPHKSAMAMAKDIFALKSDIKIVDLSADYRLNAANYEKHYCPHTDKENLANAIYGLPEYYRDSIKKAHLVANPGCYPTATLLALLPFMPYIDTQCAVFIDAKSGVSGAGKSLTQNTHFPHINENCFSYSPLTHRHQIEIIQKCEDLTKQSLELSFIPHLMPLTRGMLVSIFATLKSPLTQTQIDEILHTRYKNEPFIRIRKHPVSIAHTAGSHFCDIFAMSNMNTDNKHIYINSSIDNLLRGASSQALANANLMCGLDESLGIPKLSHGLF